VFERDTFAFANETVWDYADGRIQSLGHAPEASGERYTRRCFLLCRRALQFWKFARFEPEESPLAEGELAERIRAVAHRGAWKAPLPEAQRITIPGHHGLREISEAHSRLFKDTLGAGWPAYFRPGNVMIVFPPSRRHQGRLHRRLRERLAAGRPAVVWLVTFPSLRINHAVLVYALEDPEETEPVAEATGAGRRFRYLVYDPNDVNAPKRLEYNPDTGTFSFERTFYFGGGPVDVRLVYRNLLA
jgi:hypothetical protein